MTFIDAVARALAIAGRGVEVDTEALTIDVASPTAGKVLAVVRPVARAVTFYVVHPRTVPAQALGAVGELALRATADLLDAALELDLATGAVAMRLPVVLGGVEAGDENLAALLEVAVETLEEAAARYAGAIEDVLSGAVEPRAGGGAARTARVERLAAEVEELAARADGS